MRPAAKPSRARALASSLRGGANDARGRLEAFEADPGERLSDGEVWERRKSLTTEWLAAEAGAVRAEARVAARPLDDKRRARARVRAATAEAVSGTSVVLDAEAAKLARVAACRGCGRAAEVREGGPARLWAEGWGSVRDVAAPGWPRRWWCPECWVPPVLKASDPEAAVASRTLRAWDGVTLLFFSTGAIAASRSRRDSRARIHLERDLRRLYEVDPQRAEAAVQRLVFTAPTPYLETAWRVFAASLCGAGGGGGPL